MLNGGALLPRALHLTAANSDVPTATVQEGSDALLTCSPDPVENLNEELFDWKMGETPDQRKDVFRYESGKYDGKGLIGQHEQFRGRVSHFSDQLINGNASVIIRDTKIEDSGLYTCIFPKHRDQRISKRLVVGVAPEPYISISDISKSGLLLKCVARGAFPKPELQWLDSDGVVLPAEDPEVSERGRLFDVTLQTTVNSTKTNCFRCVVKQENFYHQIERNITVPGRRPPQSSSAQPLNEKQNGQTYP